MAFLCVHKSNYPRIFLFAFHLILFILARILSAWYTGDRQYLFADEKARCWFVAASWWLLHIFFVMCTYIYVYKYITCIVLATRRYVVHKSRKHLRSTWIESRIKIKDNKCRLKWYHWSYCQLTYTHIHTQWRHINRQFQCGGLFFISREPEREIHQNPFSSIIRNTNRQFAKLWVI